MPPAVRLAEASEWRPLARALARAFEDDPAMTWFFPNQARRLERVERFFYELTFRGPYGRAGDIYTTDAQAAGAVWIPPGKWRIGAADQLRMLPVILRTLSLRWLPSRLAGFNKMEANHPEQPPHWYLAAIGTDPDHQGHGLGSALLADQLARVDAEGLPAYLESTKEANVPLYERHGFQVTGTFDLPKGPRLWLMWRDPR